MSTIKRIAFFFIAVFSASFLAARAEQISGSYSNDCGGMAHLWDLSGYYSEDNGMETESMTLSMDANGMISGQGHFNITDYYDSVFLDGDFTVSGKVKSAGTVTRVSMMLNAAFGSGQVQGYDVTFGMTLKENLEVDEVDRELVGNSSGKLKLTLPAFGKSASTPIPSSPTAAHLPDEVDGAWGLSLNVETNGTKYAGISAIHLSNGKSFNMSMSGTYSSRTGLSRITLKGTDSLHPMNLSLLGSSAFENLTITTLKGKALGQSLKLSY